jgi:hypothetical protein
LQEGQLDRERKHAAFQHYERHKPRPVANTSATSEELLDRERYRFHVVRPFERDVVPEWDKRDAMLRRLADDQAVRAVMVKHK